MPHSIETPMDDKEEAPEGEHAYAHESAPVEFHWDEWSEDVSMEDAELTGQAKTDPDTSESLALDTNVDDDAAQHSTSGASA